MPYHGDARTLASPLPPLGDQTSRDPNPDCGSRRPPTRPREGDLTALSPARAASAITGPNRGLGRPRCGPSFGGGTQPRRTAHNPVGGGFLSTATVLRGRLTFGCRVSAFQSARPATAFLGVRFSAPKDATASNPPGSSLATSISRTSPALRRSSPQGDHAGAARVVPSEGGLCSVRRTRPTTRSEPSDGPPLDHVCGGARRGRSTHPPGNQLL